MKESTLLEMQNKIKALTNVIQHMMQEVSHLRDLSVGTLETIKLMPDYEDAIKALQAKMAEEVKQKEEVKEDGAIEQDTK
jgi:hypothetical protein